MWMFFTNFNSFKPAFISKSGAVFIRIFGTESKIGSIIQEHSVHNPSA
jgi:hypothetical protein